MPESIFNWRDHVQLDIPDVRARTEVIRSLDAIASFHDGEGEALIRAAAQQRGGRIHIQEGDSTQLLENSPNTIQINRADIARLTNHDGARSGPETLTGVLTHELYHAADDTRDVDQAAVGAFHEITGLPPENPAAQSLVSQLHAVSEQRNQSMAVTMNAALLSERDDVVAALAMEADPQARAAASRLQAMEPEAVAEALKQHHVVGDYFRGAGGTLEYTSQQETDANHFTHAIMEKNFGDQAVQRAEYADFTVSPVAQAPVALVQEAKPQLTAGYDAPSYDLSDLGNFAPPPQVRAVAGQSEGPSR